MALKREISSEPSSSASTPSHLPAKRQKFDFQNHNLIKIYIVDAKLPSETIWELTSLIESLSSSSQLVLQLCTDVEESDVIITAVRMRRRLERHIDWNLAKQKAIVTPQWLRDSVAQKKALPCGDYVALGELHRTTVQNCPHGDLEEGGCKSCSSGESSNAAGDKFQTGDSSKANPKLDYKDRFCCRRNSPLVCRNQQLVAQLSVLRLHRELEGLDTNALSYERAIAVIKAYPYTIDEDNLYKEVANLPHIGDKMIFKIEEFIEDGEIPECKTISSDPRFQSLSLFTTVYGIGPSTARKLYSLGLRSIEDLQRYYDVPSQTDPSQLKSLHVPKSKMANISIVAGLALRNDLNEKIARDEVEEMHRVVIRELAQIRPGCISIITGGYRRGKTESNDVDIVISHPDLKSGATGLCKQLVERMYDKGLVTHVMHLSDFHGHNTLRTSHWDSLEKALTVFLLPPDKSRRRIHRRLDLIFTSPDVYWCAVTGWTGSKMFERDLRLWAKERGMKFDSSGITRRHDSKQFFPNSEQAVFDLLSLEWVDPTMRNADA